MKKISLPGIVISDDERMFLSHIQDMLRICGRDRRPVFSQFLDERQIMLSEMFLHSLGCGEFAFFGGHVSAVRKQLCIYGECEMPSDEDYPLNAVIYTYRPSDKPKHSDFLGALMSLGLKRSMIGDISVGESHAYVFVCDNALDDALYLGRIGRTGVKGARAELSEVVIDAEFKEIKAWLSSLRIDCALAAVSGLSRDKASAAVRSEGVTLNCRKIYAPDAPISEGDVFSMRGKGKFRTESIGGRSSKGRICVTFSKFL